MTATVKFRRSSTPGAAPTAAQLQLGEVALNTYDGALYFKKNVSGTETVLSLHLAGNLVTSDVGGGAGTLTLEHKGNQTLRLENPVQFFTGLQIDTNYTPSAGDQLQFLVDVAGTVVEIPRSGMMTIAGPIFHARHSGLQTVPHNTATKVVLSVEDFDIGSCFDSTTNSRFQPNVAGYFQFNYSVYVDNGATDLQIVVASLAKNGTIVYGGDLTAGSFFYTPSSPVAAAVSAGSEIIFLNGSTDYVELFVRAVRAPGTSNSVQSGFLSGHFVRP